MASSREMAEFVCDQLSGAGAITCKKMFGEFGLYCGGVYFGYVADDQLFFKKTATNGSLLREAVSAAPYDGAKECWLVDAAEDREMLSKLVQCTCAELPKKRKK